MLSCWNESPRQRPKFTELKATFDTLLLAGRKDDYIQFSFDASKLPCEEQLDGNFELPPMGMVVGAAQELKSQLSTPGTPGDNECTLLLPSEKPPNESNSMRRHSSDHSSPRLSLSPRKWSSKQNTPQRSRQSSPGGRQGSPQAGHSPKSQSPIKKQQNGGAELSVAPQRSSLLLFPGSRSPKLGSGSLSPQGHSPCHAPNPVALEVDQERHRPASLFLSRDREREREREGKEKPEDRYVKEPTKLANLNHSANHNSMTGLASNGAPQQLQLRRGSEGTLNMTSDGYVSFVGMDYRDVRAEQPPPPPADIQIMVTEDL